MKYNISFIVLYIFCSVNDWYITNGIFCGWFFIVEGFNAMLSGWVVIFIIFTFDVCGYSI